MHPSGFKSRQSTPDALKKGCVMIDKKIKKSNKNKKLCFSSKSRNRAMIYGYKAQITKRYIKATGEIILIKIGQAHIFKSAESIHNV